MKENITVRNSAGVEIISLRNNPEKLKLFCSSFSNFWGKPEIYQDCMANALTASAPLPQWFLMLDRDEVLGGCGLITNDFISRMDLYPWLCALFVNEKFRHQGLSGQLIEYSASAALDCGFETLYCCTDHIGYYEKYQFEYIGTGYHPWNETSRIYRRHLKKEQYGN